MFKDNSTISFDFLGSFWNITSCPTSHALSDGIISGTLRRYQAVSIEAVPVASHPKLVFLFSLFHFISFLVLSLCCLLSFNKC